MKPSRLAHVLGEAVDVGTGLGVEPRAFRIGLGGALTGAFTYGTQHDSLTALATYQEANAALPDPPIGRILRAGAAELLGSSLGYLIDL